MQDSNLNCQQLEDALDAYYDLELDGEQAEAVEAHLSVCAACTARLVDIENVVTQIKSLPDVALSRDLSSVIEAKILSDNVIALSPKAKSKTHLYWLASAASVLALCFSLGQFKPLAAPIQENSAPRANQNHGNDKDELVAYYEYENTDNGSDLGINTNEDGLYAIKL